MARLPVYHRSLTELAVAGVDLVSSDMLAEAAGVNAAKVRKDLSFLGTYGTRGVGYDVEYLRFHVSRALGLTNNWPVGLIGLGNLGRALIGHGDFARRGFPVVAAFETDPDKIGRHVGVVPVFALDDLPEQVEALNIAIAVIATPADSAQEVADRLVTAGVNSILSFAPTVLSVPENVSMREVDLVSELQILGFHLQQALTDPLDTPESLPS